MRKTQSKKISHNSTRRTAYAIRLVHMNPGSQSVPLNANRTDRVVFPDNGFYIIMGVHPTSMYAHNLADFVNLSLS